MRLVMTISFLLAGLMVQSGHVNASTEEILYHRKITAAVEYLWKGYSAPVVVKLQGVDYVKRVQEHPQGLTLTEGPCTSLFLGDAGTVREYIAETKRQRNSRFAISTSDIRRLEDLEASFDQIIVCQMDGG